MTPEVFYIFFFREIGRHLNIIKLARCSNGREDLDDSQSARYVRYYLYGLADTYVTFTYNTELSRLALLLKSLLGIAKSIHFLSLIGKAEKSKKPLRH